MKLRHTVNEFLVFVFVKVQFCKGFAHLGILVVELARRIYYSLWVLKLNAEHASVLDDLN